MAFDLEKIGRFLNDAEWFVAYMSNELFCSHWCWDLVCYCSTILSMNNAQNTLAYLAENPRKEVY